MAIDQVKSADRIDGTCDDWSPPDCQGGEPEQRERNVGPCESVPGYSSEFGLASPSKALQ